LRGRDDEPSEDRTDDGAGEGSDAIAVVQVDSKVPEAALAELRKIEAVKVAKTVRL